MDDTFDNAQGYHLDDIVDDVHDSDGHADSPVIDDDIKEKKTRGSTWMHEIIRMCSEGDRRVVQYNENRQLIGCNTIKMKSFIRTSVRSHVPIIYNSWKAMSFEIKEKIWDLIQGGFVVNHGSKNNLMQNVGVYFRQFKYALATKYIMPFKDDLEKLKCPSIEYSHIEQEH